VNSPREVLHLVNSALLRILPQGVFFTMIYARLNRAAGQLHLVNAAHPPAILLRQDSGHSEIVWGECDVVGAFHDAVFDCRDMPIASGDRLFLYSDGLIDTTDSREGGVGGLLDVLGYWKQSLLEQAVRGTVNDYCSSGSCEDDVLLMGIDV